MPLTKFTGVDISRDRAAGTVTLSMGTYVRKLQDRRKQVPARDMPTGKSKALRAAFENLERDLCSSRGPLDQQCNADPPFFLTAGLPMRIDGVNLAAPYQPSPGVGVTGDCLHDPW